ncbi:MAG: S1 RNA-binding domain-containing protein [Anaerolineae bacterium]|jgi:small subunit ribosomal protein S1|nr:S1 RNA-binding domain-containing protein [Anaerolineae bacterium]
MSTGVKSPGHNRPPQVEESYWAALLREGEYARASHPEADHSTPLASSALAETATPPDSIPIVDETSRDWQEIEQIMSQDEILELKVIGYNRGGLLVEWRSLRGFVPASQLVAFSADHREDVRRSALMERLGSSLELRVIELDKDKNRLIFSERAARVKSGTRSEILHRLNPGDRSSGFITNLCDFGAFVDLGGVEGLIHISELSWGRVGHPADLLQRGQQVQVYVLEVDSDNARIALSLKRLHPDPWATVAERYQVGETVTGTITNVVDFGAFACIEEGLEGLIHFSELAEGHFLHPRNVVAEGDTVQARILSIDGKARRLGLSLRLK